MYDLYGRSGEVEGASWIGFYHDDRGDGLFSLEYLQAIGIGAADEHTGRLRIRWKNRMGLLEAVQHV